MKKTIPVILLSIMFCLLFAAQAAAQDTLIYSTVDYDEETDTIYGYAYTEPDYSATIYYRTAFVGAALKDYDDTMLVHDSNSCYNCRAELFLESSGNDNPPYKIMSGHYVFQTYYVYNYYDTYTSQYRNGYLDYYYYTHFSAPPGGPIVDFPLYFIIAGRSPSTVTESVNRFLGSLLTSLFPISDRVKFDTAQVHDKTADFETIIMPSATINMENSSHGAAVCDNSELFTLRVNFTLATNTTLAANRCTAKPVNIPDHDYNVATSVTCVIDDSFNNKGHLEVSVRRRFGVSGNPNPKISIGVGCSRNGPGICDSKAIVKILC